VPVGSGPILRHRNALGLGQEMAFAAGFAAVRGVAPRRLRLASAPFVPNGALTMHPSAASHVQSRPISPSSARSNAAHARSKAPLVVHSVNRSWTVDLGPNSRGSWDHCAPVRANQISPLKIARSSRRGRPAFFRTVSLLRIGASRAQRSSSPSQIVGSSFAGIAAVAAECGVSLAPGYHRQPLSG
jgi:hypothetical protein